MARMASEDRLPGAPRPPPFETGGGAGRPPSWARQEDGGATAKAVAAALKHLQKRKLARFVKTRDVWALTAAGKIEAAPLNKRASKPSGAAKGKAGAAGGPSKKASQRTEKSAVPKGAASKASSADKSKKTATARRKHLSYEFGGNDDLSQALLSSKISRVIPGTNEARPTRPVPRVLRDDSSCPFASRGLMPLFLRIGAFLRTFHGLLKISPLEVAQLKDALMKDASLKMPYLLHVVHHALLHQILYGAQETEERDHEDKQSSGAGDQAQRCFTLSIATAECSALARLLGLLGEPQHEPVGHAVVAGRARQTRLLEVVGGQQQPQVRADIPRCLWRQSCRDCSF